MPTIRVANFDLGRTVESGQIFRYWGTDGGYRINERERFFTVRQDGDKISFDGASRSFVQSFFRLDIDDGPIIKKLSSDPILRPAVRRQQGLRIIQQDPWQCLVSFILSQNSNIPRISTNIDDLSKKLGRKVGGGFAFPDQESLTDSNVISTCRLGYRAPYLHALAKSGIDFDTMRKLSYGEAKDEMMLLPGVGHKVADCALLFSLGFDEAFPVDVWIKRTVEERYFHGASMSEKQIRSFGASRFGQHAGIASQFLFHDARMMAKGK